MTIAFVVALSGHWRWSCTTALALFLIASATDYLDGALARRYGLVTDFGRLMDPLADKILVAAAFIGLIPLGVMPAWAAIIIISREFAITGLRMLAASKGIVLPAEKMGKHKTLWQIITILSFLATLAWREWSVRAEAHSVSILGYALIAITIVLTLYSGFGYLWKNRALLKAE